jgi:hypothetical protein
MHRFSVLLMICFGAFPAFADGAHAAHAELEAKKAEVSEAPAEAPVTSEEPVAEEPAPAPVVAKTAPAVSEKIAKLNIGGQIVFALAAAVDSIKGADKAMDIKAHVAKADQAGAFSIVGGSWIDETAVAAQPDAIKANLSELAAKLAPLKEVDPTDAAAVGGKKKELLASLPLVEKLVDAAVKSERKEQLQDGLALFKLALDPPYAYGHSQRKIWAWSAASVGAMVTMAGVASLTNPLEREQGPFGLVATGLGLTAAGIGAALIVLDDR